jgi:hypothetical protein
MQFDKYHVLIIRHIYLYQKLGYKMEIDTLAKGVGLFSSALAAIKQALDFLPDSSKKADAAAAIEKAEREFKLAEATAASKLGYEVCRKHFPPEIMLSEDDMIWECPMCKNKKDNSPFAAIL